MHPSLVHVNISSLCWVDEDDADAAAAVVDDDDTDDTDDDINVFNIYTLGDYLASELLHMFLFILDMET